MKDHVGANSVDNSALTIFPMSLQVLPKAHRDLRQCIPPFGGLITGTPTP